MGRVRTCRLYSVYSVGSECGGWIDVGVLGGAWTRESGDGHVRGGWTDELVYLVSVGGCVCERVFSVGFGPGLDSMSPAMGRWIQFAHQPRAGCIRLVQ